MSIPLVSLRISMRTALTEKRYFGEAFAGPSWDNWRVLLLAIAGEELTPDELAVFRASVRPFAQPRLPIWDFAKNCAFRSVRFRRPFAQSQVVFLGPWRQSLGLKSKISWAFPSQVP
jgi:hypothetical protein